MLDIKNKLPITEVDFQSFKDEWMKSVTPKPFEKHGEISHYKIEWMREYLVPDDVDDEQPSYKFNLNKDIISVHFQKIVYRYMGRATSGPSYDFVKMRQSWKDYDTYHCYNQNIVLDTELFFMDNCKNYQNRLEGVKPC
ncbi:MAG: hypothetical protein US15_C0020G0011 [Candidatus Moranbacteria bacterium GW2011_GWF1_36_4]|nr:MAG: hypothetical protein US15_C0020G0011 [Candidatus Moranbacteria bacterium GW2011_GWF1_36_4]